MNNAGKPEHPTLGMPETGIAVPNETRRSSIPFRLRPRARWSVSSAASPQVNVFRREPPLVNVGPLPGHLPLAGPDVHANLLAADHGQAGV